MVAIFAFFNSTQVSSNQKVWIPERSKGVVPSKPLHSGLLFLVQGEPSIHHATSHGFIRHGEQKSCQLRPPARSPVEDTISNGTILSKLERKPPLLWLNHDLESMDLKQSMQYLNVATSSQNGRTGQKLGPFGKAWLFFFCIGTDPPYFMWCWSIFSLAVSGPDSNAQLGLMWPAFDVSACKLGLNQYNWRLVYAWNRRSLTYCCPHLSSYL